MHVTDLIIYPIKGLEGIHVQEAKLTPRGFEKDRRYMLVDGEGNFYSMRKCIELREYKVDMIGDTIRVTHGSDQLFVDTSELTDDTMRVDVWGAQFACHKMSESVNAWWTKTLKQEVIMVYMTDDDIRHKYYGPDLLKSTEVSFADGYPYLVAGTASLRVLNSKLDRPVPMSRFRANIIIETNEPHEEDEWGVFAIGDENLQTVKPCARCVVTTIDIETGEKGHEPLKTLSDYRLIDKKIMFGSNVISLTEGTVKVGYPVTIGPPSSAS